MTVSRYDNARRVYNSRELYRKQLDARNVKFIRHYASPDLKYPTTGEISQLDIRNHVWKHGDRFWKLAESYYGDPSLWWVIAWFNKKPTENHFAAGDTVMVPFPLDTVLGFMGV